MRTAPKTTKSFSSVLSAKPRAALTMKLRELWSEVDEPGWLCCTNELIFYVLAGFVGRYADTNKDWLTQWHSISNLTCRNRTVWMFGEEPRLAETHNRPSHQRIHHEFRPETWWQCQTYFNHQPYQTVQWQSWSCLTIRTKYWLHTLWPFQFF